MTAVTAPDPRRDRRRFEQPGDAAAANALRDGSDRLLSELGRLRELEARKRAAGVSTPEFHALAAMVTHQSRRIFGLADGEEAVGDGRDAFDRPTGWATNDTPPRDRR